MTFKDKSIPCQDCGGEFTFTAGEQEFYAQKGFTNEPTRCPLGRRARKEGSSLTALAGGGTCPHDLTGQGQIRADAGGGGRSRRSYDDSYSSGYSAGGRDYSSNRGYSSDRGYGDRSRRDRQAYTGPLPGGMVSATVVRIDPAGRFMFVRVEDPGVDVYVHSSLFGRMRQTPREGDIVRITVEASDRGPRATSLEA